MAFERLKTQQTAQKFLARGQIDKAIAEFKKIVSNDPQDTRSWLKIGDLFTRLGNNKDAIEAYSRVAEHYAAQGIHRKAVAVYSQILRLDPSRHDMHLKLADSYLHLGLVNDATQAYEKTAQNYLKANQTRAAIQVYERIIGIDETHVAAQVALAELLSQQNSIDQACRHFERAATELKKQGRLEDFIKVSERLLFHSENYEDIARDLARVYIERGDVQLALSKLQLCYKRTPQNEDTLQLLARTFALLEQPSMAASIYQEAARLYTERKDVEGEAKMWRALLALDPTHAQANARLEVLISKGVVPEPPPPELMADELIEEVPEEPDQDQDQDDIMFVDEPERTIFDPQFPTDLASILSAEAKEGGTERDSAANLNRETAQLNVPPARRKLPSQAKQPAPSSKGENGPSKPLARSSKTEISDLELTLEHIYTLTRTGQMRTAKRILNQLRTQYPQNPIVRDAELEFASASKSFKPSGSFPNVNIVYREGRSLAARIAEELTSSKPPPVGNVAISAKEFQPPASPKAMNVGLSDGDTHFDLGIAYKEMGLLDDAIREFEMSMTNPQRECMANTMVGLCYMERGDTENAIRFFKRGLYADVRSDHEELGLYYELGNAYDRSDDKQEAIYYFQKVKKRDPKFRNVEEKLTELEKGNVSAKAEA